MKIKNLLINEYNLHILPDLTMLPLNLDDSLIKFYREIGTKVNLVVFGGTIKKEQIIFIFKNVKPFMLMVCCFMNILLQTHWTL